MQSSYEVVYNAVHFQNPDRIPVDFGLFGVNDSHAVGWNQIGTGDHTYRETVDEWGCTWQRSEKKNMGQVTGHPLIEWDLLDSYRFPDPHDPEFFDGIDEKLSGSDGKYIKTSIFMLLFERMHVLRGFENTLTDFYYERSRIEELADRIVEFNLGIIGEMASRLPGRIHGFTFTDDWGTERNTFISTELFDEFFKPRYKRIFDACHENGWDVWMHSCGKINNFLPTLIEVGCNVINMQQPTTNGIEEIGERFSGQICFQVVCDIQHTLPFQPPDVIIAEAKKLIDLWGTDKGGIVLSDYGDGEAIGVEPEKKKVMFDAFMKYDRWKKEIIA